ncbi:MAG: hypothetical protein GY859_05215 [Desulfobacterales bacterium]|nr:hypothetical protein [Desulfobacterales bacterium]
MSRPRPRWIRQLRPPRGRHGAGSPFSIERPADKGTFGVVFRPRGTAAGQGLNGF